MSTSGIVIHYIGWGCQSPNPQEIHYFKWKFLVRFARHFSGTYPWRKTRRSVHTQHVSKNLVYGYKSMHVYEPALEAAAPTVFMGLATDLATPVRTPEIHLILYFVQNFRLRLCDLDPLGKSPFYPQVQHVIQHLVSSVRIRRKGQGSHQPVIFQSRHELVRSFAVRNDGIEPSHRISCILFSLAVICGVAGG
jgi:hypothetical protein